MTRKRTCRVNDDHNTGFNRDNFSYHGLDLLGKLGSHITYRSIKVLSGYHFWGNLEEEKTYEFTVEIQTGNNKTRHTFQARFDDLSKMKKLENAESYDLSSMVKGDDKIYNLVLKTNQGEEVTLKALETNQEEITNSSDGKKITLSDLKKIKERYDLETRFLECVKDIGRIVASFFVVIPLALSALYGLWKPYEARKLISSIALAVCGTDQVAACFAPSPSFHALGGNTNKQGAF